MAELVDAPASGAGDRKVVEVRVLFWAPFVLLLFSRIIYKTRRNPRDLALGSFRIVPSVLGGSRHFCGPFAGLCENHSRKRPAHASDRDTASPPQAERQALQGRRPAQYLFLGTTYWLQA